MAEQMKRSDLCTGNTNESSRRHRQTGSSVPARGNAESEATGELPTAQTQKQNTNMFLHALPTSVSCPPFCCPLMLKLQ